MFPPPDFEKAIRLDPENAFFLAARGAAYLDIGDYDCAIADYDEAIRIDPKNADFFIARGRACVCINQYDRAITDYDEAIKLQPNYAIASTTAVSHTPP